MNTAHLTSDYVERLAMMGTFLGVKSDEAAKAVGDLIRSSLVHDLAAAVEGVPEFSNARFAGIEAFSLFRTMLYVIVRLLRPSVMLETGVLNGFGSAFILQAMAHNEHGRLISIDMPLNDDSLKDQGSFALPKGKKPGWAVPKRLRARHDIRLGRAEQLLPAVLAECAPDIFMHDSDHTYTHLMMEISFVWPHMKRGLIIVDNVEQNSAFANFSAATGRPSMVISSYDTLQRRWQHGLLLR
jgi:hypothetical protein